MNKRWHARICVCTWMGGGCVCVRFNYVEMSDSQNKIANEEWSGYKCVNEIHGGNKYAHTQTRVVCEKMKTKENGIVVEWATMTRSELFSAFASLKIFRLPFRRIHLHDPNGRTD